MYNKLILMQNNKITQWNSYAKIYDEAQGETGDPAHQLLFDPAISKLIGDVTDKVILDAGCGNGYWVRRLSQKAKQVIGIDSAEDLIEIAKSKNNPGNIRYEVMDLTGKLGLSDGTFDLILSSMVLQYLPSLENSATEFKRVLKLKGEIVVCMQHPLFQYHFRVSEKLGQKSDIFPNPVGYFDRRFIKQKVLAGQAWVDYFNRSLSDCLKPFLRRGFVLTDFAEPEFTEEILEKIPRYRSINEIPRVVILKFRKDNP